MKIKLLIYHDTNSERTKRSYSTISVDKEAESGQISHENTDSDSKSHQNKGPIERTAHISP